MKCWKCGQELADGTSVCPYCGLSQIRSAAFTDVGRALRQLFDRYGAQAVLSSDTYIVYGLGDLVQDSKKIRNLFRMALDAGLGKMALEQLQLAGKPDAMFTMRARKLITEDAGLSAGAADQLLGWLDEMIGWAGAGSAPVSGGKAFGSEYASYGVIGIDLGAAYTRAAAVINGKPVLIPTPEGRRCRPSAVGSRNGRLVVGEEALQQGVERPYTALKAQMGQPSGPQLGGWQEAPQFYTALLLRKIRQDAERYLGCQVTRAVVTVPDSFTNIQRLAVIEAGQIAGLEIRRLFNESAVSAFGALWQKKEEQSVLVCNLGGGSLDVSFVYWGDGVLEALAAKGDCTLGGEAYDICVANWMKEEFKRSSGVDLSSDREALLRLKDAARKAKEELSTVTSAHIFVPYLSSGAQGVHDLDLTLSRAKFDELTRHLVDRASAVIRQVMADGRQAMADGEYKSGETRVLLAGGASRIPAFRDMALRAAGKAAALGVQPDEAAALGAALRGYKLMGNLEEILAIDCLALPVGIETLGGVFSPLVKRNTAVPALKSEEFSTAVDDQDTVDVKVFQGNGEMAADNVFLGTFRISGIPPAKAGVPKVEVSFDVDVNGIVTVSALEKSSGKKQMSGELNPNKLSRDKLLSYAARAAQIVP